MSDFAESLRRAAGGAEPSGVDLSTVFAEEPVSLRVFVQDKQFLGNPELSEVQFDAVRHIERIYYQDLYPQMGQAFETHKKPGTLHVGSVSAWRDEPYWSLPVRMTNFITLQWAKGSGKDHICRIASMRIAYLLLCLVSPQRYYGIPEQDTVHLLNVASSSGQAQQAFFMPITRAVKTGWFADKAIPRQNTISYAKNIECISGHSDAESQEGLNLLLGIADEIDAFKSKKEMVQRKGSGREPTKSAEGILNMMRSSASTRFPAVFKNVRISYPRYLGSTIQRLTAEAKQSIADQGYDSRHYVSGPLATWEVNPRVPGKEAFAEEYREDPVMARAKYECRPARAVNPYFRNQQAVDASFEFHRTMPLNVSYELEHSSDAGAFVWFPKFHFAPDFHPIQGASYVMHGDMAVAGDRAGIAMAHVVRYSEHDKLAEDDDGAFYTLREVRPHVKVDFVIGFEADTSADPPREIQIRWARQLAFELIRRGFNIRRFTFDGFQCLSGDVEIPLLDGTSRKLRELAGSAPFWVYSIQNGRVVPGLCTKAWRTGYRDDMVEVELDNGETVRATSDHLFMLRDGTYRQAGLLRPGDSLMPLYRRDRRVSPTSELYEQIWHPEADGSGKRWRFTHSMVSHYAYGVLPRGWVTHHRNLNARDNTPENLRQMTNAEHSSLHRALALGSSETFRRLWSDPEWSALHRQRLSRAQSEAQRGRTGPESRRFRSDISFEMIDAAHSACIAEGKTPTRAEVQRILGCTQDLLYARIRAAGFSSWKAYRDHKEGVSDANRYQREWRRKQKNNHVVVAVRPAPPEDVYDLEVAEHHNFAIGAGVFVHNSTDSMQILQSKGIDTERLSTDVSEDPWKNLRDLMYEGRVVIPRPFIMDKDNPPKFLLRDELFSLTRLQNGRVDHPSDGSKDLADALACAALGAVIIGGSEDADGTKAQFEPAEFEVGTIFQLPVGAKVKDHWVHELPSVY